MSEGAWQQRSLRVLSESIGGTETTPRNLGPSPFCRAECGLTSVRLGVPNTLVFVRLAHDRRYVGTVLVLFVFIRISGRHCVAHGHEETPSINLVENASGMRAVMLLLLGCGPRGGPPTEAALPDA
jgi:uncharacterized membrane protein YhaH (DUF805 family)